MSTAVIDAVTPVVERHARRHVAVVAGVETPQGSYVVGRGCAGAAGAPDERTVFEIGSVTKTFTATLLMLLADEGVVAVDEPVQDLLPPAVRMPVRGRPITLLDLATHRSGLPRLPRAWLVPALRHSEDPYAHFTEDDVWRAAVRTRRRAPGGRWRYSNFGVGLLGHALAHRTGVPYPALLEAKVCAPLGLADTSAEGRPSDAGRTATGHDGRRRPVPHWNLAVLPAAGALRSTVTDLLAFLRAQEPGPDLRTSPGTSLARAVRATHEPYGRKGALEVCPGWFALAARAGRYGRILWHNGGTGGFRSFVACVPGQGVRVVVLAADRRAADPLGHDLLRALA